MEFIMNTDNVSKYVVDMCNGIKELHSDIVEYEKESLANFKYDVRYVESILFSIDLDRKIFKISEETHTTDDGSITFDLADYIVWEGGILKYLFSEDDEARPLLGTSMQTRLHVKQHLKRFLEDVISDLNFTLDDHIRS